MWRLLFDVFSSALESDPITVEDALKLWNQFFWR